MAGVTVFGATGGSVALQLSTVGLIGGGPAAAVSAFVSAVLSGAVTVSPHAAVSSKAIAAAASGARLFAVDRAFRPSAPCVRQEESQPPRCVIVPPPANRPTIENALLV